MTCTTFTILTRQAVLCHFAPTHSPDMLLKIYVAAHIPVSFSLLWPLSLVPNHCSRQSRRHLSSTPSFSISFSVPQTGFFSLPHLCFSPFFFAWGAFLSFQLRVHLSVHSTHMFEFLLRILSLSWPLTALWHPPKPQQETLTVKKKITTEGKRENTFIHLCVIIMLPSQQVISWWCQDETSKESTATDTGRQ